MKWIFVFSFILLILQIENSEAFDRRRCGKVYGSTDGLGKNERFWAKFFSASTSTSQFVTSTGDCRLIGAVSKEEKILFIADNADQLMNEVVRGEGDYLKAVAFLYNCDPASYDQISRKLQQNVLRIFGTKLDYSPDKVANQLDLFLDSDEELKSVCSLSGA